MKTTMYQGLRDINDAVRKEIMDKTLHVISRKFMFNLSFDSLSKEIGIHRRVIEKKFSSMDQLVDSIVKRASSVSNESALGIGSTPLSPRKKLEILTDTILGGMNVNIELAEEFVLMMRLEGEEMFSNRVQQYCGAPIFCLAKIIEEGQAKGEFVDGNPTDLSKLFWMYVQGVALLLVSYKGSYKINNASYIYSFLLA